jgi:hypothetical protein
MFQVAWSHGFNTRNVPDGVPVRTSSCAYLAVRLKCKVDVWKFWKGGSTTPELFYTLDNMHHLDGSLILRGMQWSPETTEEAALTLLVWGTKCAWIFTLNATIPGLLLTRDGKVI